MHAKHHVPHRSQAYARSLPAYVKRWQQCQVESEVNRTMEDECFVGGYYAASSKRFLRLVAVCLALRKTASGPFGRHRNAFLVVTWGQSLWCHFSLCAFRRRFL